LQILTKFQGGNVSGELGAQIGAIIFVVIGLALCPRMFKRKFGFTNHGKPTDRQKEKKFKKRK
jgi:hypothetical protein